jgi:hypothetical protein
MAKIKAGKYVVGKHEASMWLGDNAHLGNISLGATQLIKATSGTMQSTVGAAGTTFSSTAEVAGKITATAGVHSKNITVSSATADIDISSTAADLKLITTGTFANDIILPQATAANAGMKIEILLAAACATGTVQRIGFLESGDTVMNGVISLQSTSALGDNVVLGNAKVINLDADDVNTAGGAEGSVYRFYYYAANAVFAEVRGQVTTGTPALSGDAQSATGIS